MPRFLSALLAFSLVCLLLSGCGSKVIKPDRYFGDKTGRSMITSAESTTSGYSSEHIHSSHNQTSLPTFSTTAISANITDTTAISGSSQNVMTTTDVTTVISDGTTTVTNSGTTHFPSRPTLDDIQKKYDLLKIPTYEKSGQVTHPKVMYFPHKWNGYHYWMVMTPYPYGNSKFENPSIVVSNDGVHWEEPPGIKNPISGVPEDVKSGAYYSDPHIVMKGNTMEVWHRYNHAKGTPEKPKEDLEHNHWIRRVSNDGIHWSQPEEMFETNDGALSACIEYENGVYIMWYATLQNKGSNLLRFESKDGKIWTKSVLCSVPIPQGYRIWHQDVIKHNGMYYLLEAAKMPKSNMVQLFLLSSKDGINFNLLQEVVPPGGKDMWKDISFYRSTLLVKNNQFEMYVSVIPYRMRSLKKMVMPIPAYME